MSEEDKRIRFVVILRNGEKVNVTYDREFMHHLEFRGSISSTGYRSEFPFTSEDADPAFDEVKRKAQEMAQGLYDRNPAKHGVTSPLF